MQNYWRSTAPFPSVATIFLVVLIGGVLLVGDGSKIPSTFVRFKSVINAIVLILVSIGSVMIQESTKDVKDISDDPLSLANNLHGVYCGCSLLL